MRAASVRAPHPDLWKNVDLAQYQARWGGEVAADKLTGYLKPATFTLYQHGKPDRLILEQRLRPDANREIEELEAFWDETEEAAWQGKQPNDSVPPLLAYTDLMATTDSRNLETARMIYARLFGQR
ncbi:type IV toxin-antitoxin system AbiEi family antitoxin [Sulfuriferula sp.]|uniref:type IV toxin-antitoxin system AbiEi family antitoxin n=1 Tax=Sulfuriferula sp. TaxID=2025307 RepID=UPI0027311DC4|nr:type IV toxin-antitoxin system AbiEi family antitoxin [Sulfuriferula sp.]MDP2027397.1 type IV toxin-antitoxin system AbiEi family antitoxin [Sulfuriferula sp.]